MSFRSILFDRTEDRQRAESAHQPDFFADLNLDQLFDHVIAGKDDYDLAPFFWTPLADAGSIAYRHDVMRDLRIASVFSAVTTFAEDMREMRRSIARVEKLYYRRQKQRWLVDAIAGYCASLRHLDAALGALQLSSQGMAGFREYLHVYVASDRFDHLEEETRAIANELSKIRYEVLISNESITVRRYAGEEDYSSTIEKTFERFRQGAPQDYLVKFNESFEMNHIEAAVLERVARLEDGPFRHLETFCRDNQDFLDPTVAAFDREVQFYLGYLDLVREIGKAGLPFCYPGIASDDPAVSASASYDLALAERLVREGRPVVCNDFTLGGKERIIVVSGPNQGGKTTFARAFGQLHYLAALGLPVPASKARLFLFDRLFTHFERREDITTLRGKLKDELVRIHAILEKATPRSVVIMNEIFNSTATNDALFLSQRVIERILDLDLLCVCVTFIDEVTQMSDTIVSMVSTVVPDNPAERTFGIERRPADGLAYAISLAAKYGLTYERLKDRLSA